MSFRLSKVSSLESAVSAAVSIPVVGVGAGLDVDGQALVLPDMLGFSTDFRLQLIHDI